VVFKIILIFSLLCLRNSDVVARAFDNPAHNDKANFWDNIYEVDEKRKIIEIPNSGIKLYYVKIDEDFGNYIGFILQINDKKKYFGWENVTSPSYGPKLMLADLDKDGKEELIIELCKGYGTGIFEGEVHVIRQDSFEEILIENPYIILHKKITLREFPEYFEVILNDKKIIINKKGRLTPPYPQVGIGWGSDDARYEVKENKLFARVPLGISVINAEEFIVKYKFQDKILQMESVDFLDYKK